jgi:hypothetical protein
LKLIIPATSLHSGSRINMYAKYPINKYTMEQNIAEIIESPNQKCHVSKLYEATNCRIFIVDNSRIKF